MAKLTISEMRSELSRRLSGMIPTSDTTTLNAALDRATRFLDSLCSYTFLQASSGTTTPASATKLIPIPATLNIQKEVKLYINGIRLNYVPYTELQSYSSMTSTAPGVTAFIPTAFSYDYTGNAASYQTVTATSDGANNGTAITYAAPNPIVFTGITAYVNAAFTTGTMSIGTTSSAAMFDSSISVTTIGAPTLSLEPLPISLAATTTPRVTLSITGTGSVSVTYHYTQAGSTGSFILNVASAANYDLYYTRRMTMPSTGNECEIPEQWYDIIIDVAEMQQKELYRIVMAEQVRAANTERVKMFVREYNATQEANININDEMIRKGA